MEIPLTPEQQKAAIPALSSLFVWASSAWLRLRLKYKSLKDHLDEKIKDLETKINTEFKTFDTKLDNRDDRVFLFLNKMEKKIDMEAQHMREMAERMANMEGKLATVENISEYFKRATAWQGHLERTLELRTKKIKRLEKNAAK